jgi:hypothetical protein
LTSALDGGKWSASRPGHFAPIKNMDGMNDKWLTPMTMVINLRVLKAGNILPLESKTKFLTHIKQDVYFNLQVFKYETKT